MTETYDWYLENVLEHLSPEERIGDNEFEMPPFYLNGPEMRKQFARVNNSIKLTDNRIGELLAKLESDILKDSTMIFFFADNGEGMPRGKTNVINYLPKYEIGLLSDYTTAYAFRLNKENYLLEETYEAASLTGFRGERGC